MSDVFEQLVKKTIEDTIPRQWSWAIDCDGKIRVYPVRGKVRCPDGLDYYTYDNLVDLVYSFKPSWR